MEHLISFFGHANVALWTAMLILSVLTTVVLGFLGGMESDADHGGAGGDGHGADADHADGTWSDVALHHIGLGDFGHLPFSFVAMLSAVIMSATALLFQWAFWAAGAAIPHWGFAGLAGAGGAWIVLKILGPLVNRYVPSSNSTAVRWPDLVGLEGDLLSGTARPGLPAEARVRDRHGRAHFVLIEPRAGEPEIMPGSRVLLLLHQREQRFLAAPVETPVSTEERDRVVSTR